MPDVPAIAEPALPGFQMDAGDPPAKFQKIFRADIKRRAEVVRLAGIKPE